MDVAEKEPGESLPAAGRPGLYNITKQELG